MPLVRRVPKRGFNNRFALVIAEVNIRDLERVFSDGDEIDVDVIRSQFGKGRFDELKVLGEGELTKKLKVSAHRFSRSAREKIERAGGQTVVVVRRTPVADKQRAAKAASKTS